jgi:hypothetical protein
MMQKPGYNPISKKNCSATAVYRAEHAVHVKRLAPSIYISQSLFVTACQTFRHVLQSCASDETKLLARLNSVEVEEKA